MLTESRKFLQIDKEKLEKIKFYIQNSKRKNTQRSGFKLHNVSKTIGRLLWRDINRILKPRNGLKMIFMKGQKNYLNLHMKLFGSFKFTFSKI